MEKIKTELAKQKGLIALGILSLVICITLYWSFQINPSIIKAVGWLLGMIISMVCFFYREERLNKLIEKITSKNSKANKK